MSKSRTIDTTETLIGRVTHDSSGKLATAELLCDGQCPVGAAIVHDNDLVLSLNLGQHRRDLIDHADERLRFIIRHHHNADRERVIGSFDSELLLVRRENAQ